MSLPEGRKPLDDNWFKENNIIKEDKEYVVVTTIQTFRHRYVVPIDKLQEQNTDYQVDPKWALDAVTMNEVKEFSQLHLGEQISDMQLLNQEEMLQLFDEDNSYLSGWTTEKKIEWVDDCWENLEDEKQESYHDYIRRMSQEFPDIYKHGMTTPGNTEHEI